MTRARQVANFDPALFAADEVSGDKVSGGTIGAGTWEGTDVAVAHGGTGASTHTANSVLIGAGTSALTSIAPGADGQVLTSTGSVWQSEAAAGGDVTLTGTQTLTNKTLTSPILTTPELGTPDSGVVTNLSGVLPSAVTGGTGLSGIILQSVVQVFGSTFATSDDHREYQTVTNLTHTDFVVGSGNKVFLTLSIRASVGSSASGFSVQILRGVTLLMESVNNFYSQSGEFGTQIAFQNLETPGAGTYTYTVQIKNRLNTTIHINPNATTGTSSMTLLEIKG